MIRRTNVISWFAAGKEEGEEEEAAGNLASRCIQSAIVIGIIGAAATIDLGSISDACVVDPRRQLLEVLNGRFMLGRGGE